MLREFGLLFISTIIAYFYQSSLTNTEKIDCNGKVKTKNSIFSWVLFFVLCFILINHSGLRTYMNDTTQYIKSFNRMRASISELKNVDWSLGENPGFNVYKILLKSYISTSGNTFIYISSLIPVTSYLFYLKKHAESFPLAVYIFIAFCSYGFTMVAVKQSIATSIGLWAVDCLMNKKYLRGVVILVLAMLFHPYVVILAAIPFLSNSIWDKKTFIIIVATALCGIAFSSFSGALMSVASDAFGDNYDAEIFQSGTGLGFMRFAVYVAIPVESFVYRKGLYEAGNKYVNLCINASIIAACFIFVGLFGGGIMLGRMANFLDIFIILAGCYVLQYGIKDESQRNFVMIAMVACFLFYYYTYNWKYIPHWTGDLYNHITFSELLNRW